MAFSQSRVKRFWASTILGRCSRVFSRRDQRIVILFVLVQIGLSFLDLAGLAIVGILGSLAVSGIQSQSASGVVQLSLSQLGLNGLSLQAQVAILGIAAALLLIIRSLLSVYFTKKYTFFLSVRAALISARLTANLLNQSILVIQSRTSVYFLNALTAGVQSVTVGVVGAAITLVADLSIMVVLTIGLFVVDPLVSLSSLLFFVSVAALMYRLTHTRAKELGDLNLLYGVSSSEKVLEVLTSYRESVVRGRRSYYSRQIGKLRLKHAKTAAEISFLPSISKYVIETSAIVIAFSVAASQFVLYDASRAVATLTIFMVAITRIAPAVLRFQQTAIAIKSSLAQAESALGLIEELGWKPGLFDELEIVDFEHAGFSATVEIKDLDFSYPSRESKAISNLSLSIAENSTVAIVGSSGAGKSTLADLILGVLPPQAGSVKISGASPLEAISKWPGAISYVPQDVQVINGSIRENVGLGFDNLEDLDSLIWKSLALAKLDDFVKHLPHGLSTQVGERGARLSGGQRQRLGIARAFFTQPKLVLLDEATSSLDATTEFEISQAIADIKNQATIILIAHRLSTVKNSDLVIYLEEGRIRASGTFDQVRTRIPKFNEQARLMGL